MTYHLYHQSDNSYLIMKYAGSLLRDEFLTTDGVFVSRQQRIHETWLFSSLHEIYATFRKAAPNDRLYLHLCKGEFYL